MSTCQHLDGQPTLFKWRIDGYAQRLATSIWGDRWASDVFSLCLIESPQCCLYFTPPAKPLDYSITYPYLTDANWTGASRVTLNILDEISSSLVCKFWLEDECGNLSDLKQHPHSKLTGFVGPEVQKFAYSDVLWICCEIRIPNANPKAQFTSGRTVELGVANPNVETVEFLWTIENWIVKRTQQSPLKEMDDKKFRLRADHGTSVSLHNFGAKSSQLYLYESWLKNSWDQISFRKHGVVRLFEKKIVSLWFGYVGISEQAEFFGNDPVQFCANLRPIRSPDLPSTSSLVDDWTSRLQNFIANHFNDPSIGDIKIVAKGNRTFRIPKILLCAHSPVFFAMFNHKDTKESLTKTIGLQAYDERIVELMLRYLYNGKVEHIEQVDAALYVISHTYDLFNLQKICYNSMRNNLAVDKILDYLELTFTYDLPIFKNQLIAYARRNSEKIQRLSQWRAFSSSHPQIVHELNF